METTQRQADTWLNPDDIDPLANHLKRRSARTRYRDSAMIRLLADIGLTPREIAGDNPDIVVQIGDVYLSDPGGGGRVSNLSPPMGGCVLIRREVATVGPPKDVVVTFQDPKTAMVLHRHRIKIEIPVSVDPLFISLKGEPLSKRHVREITSNACRYG
ncbi:hypothetical protein PM023_17150 [Halorubrum ezzemoulense]|jgi:integrase|uniref:hypothetical protein n=1 Tax=Halorubrum ezzemoulense TaxID=337243 RepID=UPI00232D978B|nr:hypothetical protein [Halorubrum ezzemoulense]MDB2226364.1 hypothetical protein [Halorubrum ezzemoulense]